MWKRHKSFGTRFPNIISPLLIPSFPHHAHPPPIKLISDTSPPVPLLDDHLPKARLITYCHAFFPTSWGEIEVITGGGGDWGFLFPRPDFLSFSLWPFLRDYMTWTVFTNTQLYTLSYTHTYTLVHTQNLSHKHRISQAVSSWSTLICCCFVLLLFLISYCKYE